MGYRGLVLDGRMLFVAVAGVVAALLVWGLMAAPALAQATAGDVDLQSVDCSQVQAAVANQYNSGDAVAQQYGSGNATAEIAQALDINQSQVNACLGGDGTPTDNGTDDGADNGTTGDVDSSADVIADTFDKGVLPNTGGAPLPGAILGLALVAAGILSVGAIVRRDR